MFSINSNNQNHDDYHDDTHHHNRNHRLAFLGLPFLFVCLFLSVAFIAYIHRPTNNKESDDLWTETSANITRLVDCPGNDDTRPLSCGIEFTYVVNGKLYSGHHVKNLKSYRVGDQLEIFYQIHKPKIYIVPTKSFNSDTQG